MQQTLFEVSPEENNSSTSDLKVTEGYKRIMHLGNIPREWEVARVGDLVESLDAGYSAKSGDRPAMPNEKGVLKVSAVSYVRFRSSENKVVDPDRYDDLKTSPRRGDLVISRSNTPKLVGSCVYVEEDHTNLFLPDTLWRIRLTKSSPVTARYLADVLGVWSIRKRIRAIATGTSGSMKKIAMRTFRRLKVPVPPIDEQKRIAASLRTWDRALAEIDALIDAKKTRLKGLRQRLLTGEERFPEFTEPWREVPIGDLLKRVRRHVTWDEDAQYDLVSIKRDSGGMEFRESLQGSDISVKKLNTLKEGDFVISRMQVVHGATAYVPKEFDGHHASDSYYILTPRQNAEISTEFFAELSKLPYMYHLAFTSSYGVHIEKMSFNPSLYFKSKVEVPPTVEEQERIVSFLKDIQHEIDQLHALRAARAREKKGMMQRLLLGKVRV